MNFKAISSSKYAVRCLVVALILGCFTTWLGQRLLAQPVSRNLFWLGLSSLLTLGGAIYALYLAYAYWHLTYHLDRNGLQIRWGGMLNRWGQHQILNITSAAQILLPKRRFLGLPLPTWWVGIWGDTFYYATAPVNQSLLVQTPQQQLLISPTDPQAFINAWQRRRPLGATQTWTEPQLRWGILNWPLWQDRQTWLLGGGAILLTMGLLGWLSMHYPSSGVDQLTLQHLAIASGSILLGNLLLGAFWYAKTPLAAYILWVCAGLAQIGLALAAGIISG